MDASTVIDILLEQENTTRYGLAKQLGVYESLLSRAYNKKSDPGFNEVAGWLDKLGYTISIKAKPIKNIDNSLAFSVNGLGKMLANLDNDNYDYLAVHRYLKQLIESYSINPRPIKVSVPPSRIKNNNWRAFYAAVVAYLFDITGQTTPKSFSGKSNRLKQQWSPIKKLGKSHTNFDSTFASYNVLLPEGELKWI